MNDIDSLIEGLETANNIKHYDEGVADVINNGVRAVKNFFGTSADAAKRNNAAAAEKQQTAATNANTEQTQSPADAAQQIINLLNKALKNDQKMVDKQAKEKDKAAYNKKVDNVKDKLNTKSDFKTADKELEGDSENDGQ